MRAPFNDTCSVRYGPTSVTGPPFVIYGVDIPCRLVTQLRIFQAQVPLDQTGMWVTLNEVDFVGPLVTHVDDLVWESDYGAADQLSFASRPTLWYSLCRREEVLPRFSPPYHRWMLLPRAAGPVAVTPGVSCSATAAIGDLGQYTLSMVGFTAPGWYSFVPPPGQGQVMRLAEPFNPRVRVDVFSALAGSTCCNATLMGGMTAEGAQCVGFGQDPLPGAQKRFCFLVSRQLFGTAPEQVVVQIDQGVCS